MSITFTKTPDTLEDFTENPEKFGMPSFEQFRKNKEKYMGRPDDEIADVDRGDRITKLRHIYYIQSPSGHEYRLDAIEQAERLATEMGLNLFKDFTIDPQIRDDSFIGMHNRVTFRPKILFEKRNSA